MDDEELANAIRKGASAQRGYADFDTWPDRRVRDLGLGRDFADELRVNFGTELSNLHVVPAGCDPPDLIAGDIGIELTELVDPYMVRGAVLQRRAGASPSQYRDWSQQQLLERLRQIVRRKDCAAVKHGRKLSGYWLVVHTDEPGLTPAVVTAHLEGWLPMSCQLLTRCFLLMSYFPDHAGRPLFELVINGAA